MFLKPPYGGDVDDTGTTARAKFLAPARCRRPRTVAASSSPTVWFVADALSPVIPAGGVPKHPRALRWVPVAKPNKAELDSLVEQATVDAYDEYEQMTGFEVMLDEHLALPFRTTVLGVEVTVTKIQQLPGSEIVAICVRGEHRQAIGILDLPLPTPGPAGSEWIDAYRHWVP